MGDRITSVDLDVHKEGIVVVVAEGGIRSEVPGICRIAKTGRRSIAASRACAP